MRTLPLLALVVACVNPHAPIVVPVMSFTFIPPMIYQQWANEVQACVRRMAELGDTSFVVERTLKSVYDVVWLAVPTEAEDAHFMWSNGRRYRGFRTGPAGADTIALSGQLLSTRWLVKHEIMHIDVKNPAEDSLMHGRPWGLCEYQ